MIPENYRTFTHGYAVTSHAAQGKTVDEVMVVASSRSLPAVHQEQFYVSISRGRERCQIFTDDVELLRSHVTRSSVRLAAVEVVPHIHRQKFIQNILQRGNRFLKQFASASHNPFRPAKTSNKPMNHPMNTNANPDAASASSPHNNLCFDIDPAVAALNALADDERSYQLPYAQFLYAEMDFRSHAGTRAGRSIRKISNPLHQSRSRGAGERPQDSLCGGFKNMN